MIRDAADGSEHLTVLAPSAYSSEDMLQSALENHPGVLAGIDSNQNRRPLLLLKREKGVPVEKEGIDWFSADHLFVDPEGMPVVVEVKRSTDTRIRREVVGQMLDYAANGLKYWPVAQLQRDLEETQGGPEAAERAVQEISDGDTPEEFWRRVEANLRSGRIRLVFVADQIPKELERVIEFLNEQMSPAEVLGVEVPLYQAEGARVLVPRIIGATSTAAAAKSQKRLERWGRRTFLEQVGMTDPESVTKVVRIIDHVEQRTAEPSWGTGQEATLPCWYDVAGKSRPVWYLRAGSSKQSASVTLYGSSLLLDLGADQYEVFLGHLCEIEAFRHQIEAGSIEPKVNLSDLTEADVSRLLEVTESLGQFNSYAKVPAS